MFQRTPKLNKTVNYILTNIFVNGSLIILALLVAQTLYPRITRMLNLDILIIFLFIAGMVKVALE